MEAKIHPGARVYHAILWKAGEPIEVHHMTMEPTVEQSRTRAVSSMNWFNDREAKVLVDAFDKKKPRAIFHANIKCQQAWDFHVKFERRAFDPDPAPVDSLPQFTHTSIWEFYKAIGYDYKAKRYTRAD